MSLEDVQREWLKVLDALEDALDDPESPKRNTQGLMTQYGALMTAASQKAFQDQKFGDYEWPPRYPGMEDPFINIAGALEDFNAGHSKPKPSRFQNRPALVDEGMRGGLWGSITWNVPSDHEVEYGSDKSYARLMNEGGENTIRVSEDAYRLGRDWLFTKKGDPRKGREGYVKKLWPSLFRRFLNQNIIKRPFLGVTTQTAEDMIRTTRSFFEREADTGGGARSTAS